MKKSKVILLTGASSGIGYETAVMLSRKGHRVYGAARRVEPGAPLDLYLADSQSTTLKLRNHPIHG